MKIVVHFCDTTAEIQVAASSQTWGRLCQQFCETKLLHRPQLLQLLTCLDNDAKNTNYMFRYGDGNGTVIRVAWNCGEEGQSNSDALVDANITLRPRSTGEDDGPDGASYISPDEPVAASFFDGGSRPNAKESGSLPEKIVEVDFHVEKVGLEEDDDATTWTLPFAITQAPFSTDDNKTHVMFVKEHSKFNGVVDRYLMAYQRFSGDWLSQFSIGGNTGTISGHASGSLGESISREEKDGNLRGSTSSIRKRRQSSPTRVTKTTMNNNDKSIDKPNKEGTKSSKRSESRTKKKLW